MAWVKVDDRFTRGPKVTRASYELGGKNARGRVIAVWLDMMSYCNLNTTDGFVPAHEVPTMADADPKAVIKAMSFSDERMGPLVESVDGGWQMRNYAEYQPTRADIDAAKQRTASRQKAWRERKSNSVTPPSRDVMSQHPEPNRSEPNRTEPERTEDLLTPADIEAILAVAPFDRTQDQNETLAEHRGVTLLPRGTRPSRPSQSIASREVVCRKHYGSGVLPSCAKGVCVPAFLGQSWEAQIPDDATAYVRQFIADVCRGITGPVGDDPLAFWRAQWKAKHGTVIKSGFVKGDATLEAARRLSDEYAREDAAVSK